jgi:hypothetical protein
MRWKPDEQDLWCGGWAATRRAIHGIGRHKPICPQATEGSREPCICIEPKERIGKLKCTLGRIREDREGAASAGVSSHRWPEVYSGMSLLIHRAWYEMPERVWMLVMDGQYVWREIPVKVKAAEIGIKDHEWFDHLIALKGYLRGYVQLARRDSDEDFVPVWRPSATFVRTFDERRREPELIEMT